MLVCFRQHEPEIRMGPGKATSNLSRHGVSFQEALSVFGDPLARIFDDEDHSIEEHREIIIGHSVKERLLIVLLYLRGGVS